MGRIVCFFFFLIFQSAILYAQAFDDARSLALAKSNLALNNQSLWGSNPSGLSLQRSFFEFNVSNQFMIPDLNMFSASYTLVHQKQNFSFGIAHFGHPYYFQNRYILNYSRAFGLNLFTGIRFRLQQNSFQGYSNYFDLHPDIGVRYVLSKKSSLAFAIEQLRLGAYTPYGSSAISSGYAYTLSDKVNMCFQLSYFQNRQSIHGGMEYIVTKELTLRTGFQTATEAFSFGLTYKLSDIHIDISCHTHPVLDHSTAIGLRYEL